MVSILMSTHNPIEKYFKECLDSIFNQSYQEFEIILIDDGSTINVYDLITKYNYDTSKINYIKLEKNVGLPKALNIGLEHAKGEYIARMDDDDIMEPTRLEKKVEFLESNNYDGCWSWYERIDKNGNSLYINKISLNSSQCLKYLVSKGNIFCHSTLFIKTSILKKINGYDENLRYAQDSDLYIRILDKYNMGIINESLLKSRVNDYRNNSYRETLSLTYSLFGAMNYYTNKDTKKIKSKFLIFLRILRYYFAILKIEKNNRK